VVKQAQEAQNMDKASMVSSHETGIKNDDKTTDASTKSDHNSIESTTDPSSLPQKFVADVFSPQPLPTGSIQAKTLEKIT